MVNDEHGRRIHHQGSQRHDADYSALGGTSARVSNDGSADVGAEELLGDAARINAGHWQDLGVSARTANRVPL